ncbi:hypothetical protein diail_5686 [Diaporthe ilicicola]|nr:hypothetical protein diail_5686 [Diaporthe ilicicola]
MSSVFDLLGESDNLNDPVPTLNRGPAIYGMVFSFLILSTLCAIWRIWIRLFVTRVPGWDDAFVVLAVLSNIGQAVGMVLAHQRGLGKHFLSLGIEGMRGFIRSFYIANGTYPMCTTFIKLALLFQYMRLFKKGTRLRAYWDWTIPDSQVLRYGFGSHDVDTFVATYLTNAATNVVLDLIIFAIPIPLYLENGIQTKSRWALSGLFVLGAMVNVSSICRLVSMVETRATTYPTLDPSWYGCIPAVLSALEVHLATICASMPVFWPVIKENLGRILVVREVNVTRETRDFSNLNNSWNDSDMYALDAFNKTKKHHLDQSYILSQVDPLREEKPTTTTVMAMGQQANRGATKKPSLDLGMNFTTSLSPSRYTITTIMPGYVIQGCTVEDGADVARNNMTSFWQDVNWRMVWRHTTLPRVVEACTARSPRNLLKDRALLRHFKAVDPETGRFMGYARWKLPPGYQENEDGSAVWPEGQTPDVTPEERAKIEEVADAADWELDHEGDHLDAPITRRKIEYLARKDYLVLDFFAVYPDNQRKGVGTALLEYGIEKARELNLDIFVLGMVGGLGIYQRMGFKLMETVTQDATPFGGNDNYTFHFLEYEIRTKDKEQRV